MSYLHLLVLPAAAFLVLVLCYAVIVGWSVVLGRMAQSVSTWDELEENDANRRQAFLGNLSS